VATSSTTRQGESEAGSTEDGSSTEAGLVNQPGPVDEPAAVNELGPSALSTMICHQRDSEAGSTEDGSTEAGLVDEPGPSASSTTCLRKSGRRTRNTWRRDKKAKLFDNSAEY